MNQSWKGVYSILCACLALCLVAFVAPQTAPGVYVFAAQSVQDNDFEFDENQNDDGDDEEQNDEDEEEDVLNLLEDEEALDENASGEDFLNLATELKITASNFRDLTKVISYCNKAEKRGLDDDNLEFAKQLRLSAQLDRGLAVAQMLLNPKVEAGDIPGEIRPLIELAINDLNEAKDVSEESAILNTALGRLYMISDAKEKAKGAFDQAIATENDEQTFEGSDIRALACIFRADLEDEPEKAIEFIKKGLEINAKTEPLLFAKYAEKLLATDRALDAAEQINKALDIEPDNPDFMKTKALVLAALRQYSQARELYEEATLGLDDVMSLAEKGRFLASIQEPDEAIKLFSRLIDRFGGPGLYFLRGLTYAQKKDFERALIDVNQALRIDSDFIGAIRLKGSLYIQMKKYDLAVRVFQQLQKKSKDADELASATSSLAFAYFEGGKYKSGVKVLDDFLKDNPDNLDILRARADGELNFGHWELADQFYQKLLEMKPDDTGVLNNYSWLLGTCPDDQRRDAKRALEYAKKAAEMTQYNTPHILSTLAAAYAENGDFESARSWAQKAAEIAEIENEEHLDSYRDELQSYKENKPWRKTSAMTQEVDEEDESASDNSNDDEEQEEEEKNENDSNVINASVLIAR